MATKPKTSNKPTAKPPAAKAKAPAETPPAAGELAFDSPTAPVIFETTAGDRPDSRAAKAFEAETIHASECVVNSECTLTPHCRGRLKQTNAISGKVQIFCPKCSKFAAGTRPAHGLVATSGGKLFDRTGGK